MTRTGLLAIYTASFRYQSLIGFSLNAGPSYYTRNFLTSADSVLSATLYMKRPSFEYSPPSMVTELPLTEGSLTWMGSDGFYHTLTRLYQRLTLVSSNHIKSLFYSYNLPISIMNLIYSRWYA